MAHSFLVKIQKNRFIDNNFASIITTARGSVYKHFKCNFGLINAFINVFLISVQLPILLHWLASVNCWKVLGIKQYKLQCKRCMTEKYYTKPLLFAVRYFFLFWQNMHLTTNLCSLFLSCWVVHLCHFLRCEADLMFGSR